MRPSLNSFERAASAAIYQTCLVIDVSVSMSFDDWKPSRLAGAMEAALALLDAKCRQFPRDQIAVVSFAHDACLELGLTEVTTGAHGIHHAIQRLAVRPSTNIPSGLNMAAQVLAPAVNGHDVGTWGGLKRFIRELFEPAPAAAKTGRHVLLLTDGFNCLEVAVDSVASAQRLKNEGVEIDVIGIGGTHSQVNEDELRRVASLDSQGRPRYRYIGDKSTLIQEFVRIANRIEELPA